MLYDLYTGRTAAGTLTNSTVVDMHNKVHDDMDDGMHSNANNGAYNSMHSDMHAICTTKCMTIRAMTRESTCGGVHDDRQDVVVQRLCDEMRDANVQRDIRRHA